MNDFIFEKVDWIAELYNKKFLSKDAIDSFELIFLNKGYISGGGAKVLSNYFLGISSSDESINSYFGNKITSNYLNANFNSQNYWKSYKGDIDVFFNDRNDAYNAKYKVLSSLTPRIFQTTKGGFGYEFLHGDVIFQLITKINGSPKEITDSFDIANAKVYLDDKGIYYTNNWKDLESKRLLGIDLYNKPNLLWRVQKWFKKHNYVNLRDNDHEKYVDILYEAAEKVKDQSLIRFEKPVSEHQIQKFVKSFIYNTGTPANEILKASLLLNSYSQMYVLKDLSQRYI